MEAYVPWVIAVVVTGVVLFIRHKRKNSKVTRKGHTGGNSGSRNSGKQQRK